VQRQRNYADKRFQNKLTSFRKQADERLDVEAEKEDKEAAVSTESSEASEPPVEFEIFKVNSCSFRLEKN
jgi:ABC-type transporter MlaC component